jgi:hypothetical protein
MLYKHKAQLLNPPEQESLQNAKNTEASLLIIK